METISFDAIWYVGKSAMLFAGPLSYNAPHSHSTSIYIAGIYDFFQLRFSQSKWISCRAAVIPAGVSYELDVRGSPIGVYYLEPSIAGVSALVPLLGDSEEVCGALVGQSGEYKLLRELYEDAFAMDWADHAMMDLVNFSQLKARSKIDRRISYVAENILNSCTENRLIAEFASEVGLSCSRLQHLFRAELGVPFRRYRAWHRLRAAIGDIIAGNNFTIAAHNVGYYDQAHFGHDFRRTFGAPPSQSLSNVRPFVSV